MLYLRDYTVLTEHEQELWDKAEKAFAKASHGGLVPSKAYTKYFNDLPLAALHYKQLFPNNYLEIGKLKTDKNLSDIKDEFKVLLDSGAGEREVLNFIRDKEAAFIVASIFKKYDFGHHEAFAFREFELPPNHVVDFLLVGKNSGGYEFIFVELETPIGSVTTKNGDFGSAIRKGLSQIEDWVSWIEVNYPFIKSVYNKYLGKMHALPTEFLELDKSRMHYVVVAGRRKDFSSKTRLLKRRLKKNGILLLHYDNLLDNVDLLLQHGGY